MRASERERERERERDRERGKRKRRINGRKGEKTTEWKQKRKKEEASLPDYTYF